MEQDLSDAKERTPSSRGARGPTRSSAGLLHAWLAMSTLHQRSFGLVMLLLGLLAHGEEKGLRS